MDTSKSRASDLLYNRVIIGRYKVRLRLLHTFIIFGGILNLCFKCTNYKVVVPSSGLICKVYSVVRSSLLTAYIDKPV